MNPDTFSRQNPWVLSIFKSQKKNPNFDQIQFSWNFKNSKIPSIKQAWSNSMEITPNSHFFGLIGRELSII